MMVAAPAWYIDRLLQLPELVEMREATEKLMESEDRKKPQP
jgi:hypothetical protein